MLCSNNGNCENATIIFDLDNIKFSDLKADDLGKLVVSRLSMVPSCEIYVKCRNQCEVPGLGSPTQY